MTPDDKDLLRRVLEMVRLAMWHTREVSKDKEAKYELTSGINECDELTWVGGFFNQGGIIL